MKQPLLILLFTALCLSSQAQCLSELLFLEAPDTLCANRKDLVLRTSKAKETGVVYLWRLPNGDSVATSDSILIIPKPRGFHSGNYFVLTKKDNCASEPVGPVRVTVLGVNALKATVKDVQVCGVRETVLSSQFKTSNSITGQWVVATEGVEVTQRDSSTTTVRNLNIGKNLLIWVVSTATCPSFARDSFQVTLEGQPKMSAQTVNLTARNASVTLPLGTVSGSNLDVIKDIEIKISTPPKAGQLSIRDRNLKYSRKPGFQGTDQFSITVCNANTKCPNLCSAPVSFQITVDFNADYPAVTIPKLLSPRQVYSKGWVIENVENYPENELHILDRWGGVIEKFINYSNAATWDGTQSGKFLPSGAYYYVFYAKRDNNSPPKTDFKALSGIFYIVE